MCSPLAKVSNVFFSITDSYKLLVPHFPFVSHSHPQSGKWIWPEHAHTHTYLVRAISCMDRVLLTHNNYIQIFACLQSHIMLCWSTAFLCMIIDHKLTDHQQGYIKVHRILCVFLALLCVCACVPPRKSRTFLKSFNLLANCVFFSSNLTIPIETSQHYCRAFFSASILPVFL